ncbi:phosphoadenosine phosphosulfate reductase [Cribrihabitans marinus]|nr:phosphoadenosine phosphosulfate reductase [Cribrihabitans marinus]
MSRIDESIAGYRRGIWRAKLIEQAEAEGMAQDLGEEYFATFIDRNSTLLVTFETAQAIRARSDTHQPLGFKMVKAHDWSHLCIIAGEQSWFRDEAIYDFFDRLIDDGFFEDFDRVLFHGSGACGYAAAAYSVASPGATALLVQPQATLDPRMTEWDDRFRNMRRSSFTDRYGYAPDMLDAAERAFVIYDPAQQLDAMHASLFQRANVTRLRMRNMGGYLQSRLAEMRIFDQILTLAGRGELSAHRFYQLYRARRSNARYLKALAAQLNHANRPGLETMLCRSVLERMPIRRLRRRLDELTEAQAGETPGNTG